MKIDIDFLLKGSKDLLASIARPADDIRVPNFIYKCYMVLAPEGYVWDEIVINLYDGTVSYESPPVGVSVVYHGHENGKTCFAQDMCHVLGYVPVGDEHPAFLKRWNAKWVNGT